MRGIHIYPLSCRHPPKRTAALSFPKLGKMTGWVFLTPIEDFKTTPVEIETALARFAGSRWNAPERPGEIIQNDTIDRQGAGMEQQTYLLQLVQYHHRPEAQ